MSDRGKADAQTLRSGVCTQGLWIALAWMTLIFGTSCTVVMPHELFAWLDKHLLRNETSAHGFRVFWGFSWFAIVKGWHALEFAVLFLLLQRSLGRLGMNQARSVVLAVFAAIGFAVSDEWHQTFVPGRGGSVMDVLIDSLGALAAAILTLRRREFSAEAQGCDVPDSTRADRAQRNPT